MYYCDRKLYLFKDRNIRVFGLHMNQIASKYSWVALLLLGCTSGILSDASLRMPEGVQFFWVGAVFGVALCVYFALYRKLRNPLKMAFVIGASVMAYFLAFYGSFSIVLRLPNWMIYHSRSDGAQLSIVACGGLIGGFLIVGSTLLMLRSSDETKPDLLRILLGSVLSGILGIIGWRLGPSLGKTIWEAFPSYRYMSPDNIQMCSLYPVWQTGMALSVGLFTALQQKEERQRETAPAELLRSSSSFDS